MPPESNTRAYIALAVVGLLLATGLAGCVGGSGGSTDTDGVDEDDVTNATDPDEVRNKTKNSTIKVKRGTELDPNSTYHIHDAWGDRTEVTILDPERDDAATQTIDYQQFYTDCLPNRCNNPSIQFDIPQRRKDGSLVPNTVFQGTGEITIELSWEGETLNGNPSLCVSNEGVSAPCKDPATILTFEENGGEKSITYSEDGVLRKETWDPPHARKSNWRFSVLPCEVSEVPGTSINTDCVPAVQQTSFTLQVTVHRGDMTLPLDPPHFSFYGTDQELTILDGYQLQGGRVITADDWYYATTGSSEARPLWLIGPLQISDAGSKARVVPPKTAEVVVELAWSDGDPQETPLELRYLSAREPWGDWQEPSNVEDCAESDLSNCKVYSIPTAELQPDSLYARKTQWRWGVFLGSDAQPDGMLGGSVEISITTHKGASA